MSLPFGLPVSAFSYFLVVYSSIFILSLLIKLHDRNLMMNFLVIEFFNLIVYSVYVHFITDRGIEEFLNPERTENIFIIILYGIFVIAFVLRIIFNYVFNHSREKVVKLDRKYYIIIIAAFISLFVFIWIQVSAGYSVVDILNVSIRVLIVAIIIAAILIIVLRSKIKKITTIKIKIKYVLIVTLIGITPNLLMWLLFAIIL